jgi:hypothetical protein
MPLPSLWVSGDDTQAWSITRAAGYGAALGLLAAVFKTLGPLHEPVALTGAAPVDFVASIPEIAGAAVVFALLCAGAAVSRNLIARRLIWPDRR